MSRLRGTACHRFAEQKVIKHDGIDADRWIVVDTASKRVGSARNPHATNIFSRIKDYPQKRETGGADAGSTNCSDNTAPNPPTVAATLPFVPGMKKLISVVVLPIGVKFRTGLNALKMSP